MVKLEVFFDYLCPYCYRGHQNLKEALKKFPATEVAWRPCEAHPRPEVADSYSDRAIQGMYLVQELGGNLWNYHDAVYSAVFEQNLRIDSAKVLADCAGQTGVDAKKFLELLEAGRYLEKAEEGNRYAWGKMAWEAVPSYYMNGRALGSRNGILVPLAELERFLQKG